MAQKFTKFLLIGLALIAIQFGMGSYSNTGSIISGSAAGGCSCHGPMDINTVITVLGLPSAYVAGQTYPITVLVENPTQVAAGINLEVTTGTITNVGSQLINVSTTEIRHTSPKLLISGIANFTFDWVAPTMASGPVSIVASANATNANGNTLGDSWNSVTTSTPLSINYLAFEVSAKPNAVTLNWKTVDESKIKSFIIERSVDGVLFDSLDIVIANGSSTVGRIYDYSDKPNSSNDYFYRLRINDFTGGKTYTTTKKITFNNGAEMDFILFPNPVSSANYINMNIFNNMGSVAYVNVYARGGELVYHKKLAVKKGTNYISLNKKFSVGYYAIEVVAENGKKIKKAFVAR